MNSTSLLFALALLAGAPQAQQQDIGIPLGSKAPAAIVQTLDGNDVSLGNYIGKGPVVIEFWATWCPNCKELEPSLLSLVKQYEGRVTFIGVAVSVNESPERVRNYAAKHSMTHVILYDTRGTASEAYDVPATSYVVVIDRTGKVVYTGLGGDQKLSEAVKKGL